MPWVGRDFKDPVLPTTLAPVMADNENISQKMHVSRKCSTIAITLCKESVIFYTPTDLQCSPQSSAISYTLSPLSCILLSGHVPQHYLPISCSGTCNTKKEQGVFTSFTKFDCLETKPKIAKSLLLL